MPAPGGPPPLRCPLPAATVGLLPGWCLLLRGDAVRGPRPPPLPHPPTPHPDARQGLFKRAEAPPASGLAERPLYKPSEMVQMGPFKVSPMGFGTWAWCALNRDHFMQLAFEGWQGMGAVSHTSSCTRAGLGCGCRAGCC